MGDRVLCRFAEHVTSSIRAGDLFGRIGGEEFAILLVGAFPSATLETLDRIRIALGLIEIPAGSATLRVTASFGVTGPVDPEEELTCILARADAALYRSKMSGRNRVTVAPPPPAASAEPKEPSAADAALALSGTAAR